MTSADTIEAWIAKNEPVEQEQLVEQFGQNGLTHLRNLMQQNRVSYNLNWKLQTDERGDFKR